MMTRVATTVLFVWIVFLSLLVGTIDGIDTAGDDDTISRSFVPRQDDFVPLVHTAIELTKENYDINVRNHTFAFVHMYVPWSVWCQRLAPVWDEFAQSVGGANWPLRVAKLDCMAEADLCRKYKVMAYPTLMWFHHGQVETPHYKMDRTVEAFMDFARQKMSKSLHWEEEDNNVEEEDNNDEEIDDVVGNADESPEKMELMDSKCRSSGYPYGDDGIRFSKREGDEFLEYSKASQVRIAPSCQSASSNPRGTYSSFSRPCDFQFHAVTSATTNMRQSIQFRLSEECSKDNVVHLHEDRKEDNDGFFDYVRGWPDECVGDFVRCYSVSKESEAQIFMKHFCLQKWDLPPGVTHISMTCQRDKMEAKQLQNSDSRQQLLPSNIAANSDERRHREIIAAIVLVILLVCCCVWLLLCFGYRLIAVPYLKALKKSKSDPDLQSLTSAVDGNTEKD